MSKPQQSLLGANTLLADVLSTKNTWASDGSNIPLSSGITIENAQRLYGIAHQVRPLHVLEIGMAHGISSVAILTALEKLGAGSLISIDPFENDHWQGAGVELVRRSGLASRHTLISEPDYYALPRLLKEQYSCSLAYIDGMHSFEFTFLDFFFVDRLLDVNGLVGFNDCGMPAVQKVIRYITTHLDYAEEDSQPLSWLQRRKLKFWEYPDRWFRKIRNHTVPWDYHQDF